MELTAEAQRTQRRPDAGSPAARKKKGKRDVRVADQAFDEHS